MQQPDSSRILPRALLMVTREEDQAKIDKILSTADIPIYFQARGLGTAPSEIMDILGLSGGAKQVTMGFLPKYMVKPVFETLNETCSLRKRGHGASPSPSRSAAYRTTCCACSKTRRARRWSKCSEGTKSK